MFDCCTVGGTIVRLSARGSVDINAFCGMVNLGIVGDGRWRVV
jgi:hypothetical protein